MHKLKQNKNFILISSIIISALSLWYVIWSFFDGGILNLRYFTNQSVMIVFATMLLYLAKCNQKPYFKFVAAVALINIFITSTGFHFILSPDSVGLQGHLSHTIVPIFYIVFYFIIIEQKIKVQQFWVGVIYPMTYLFLSILMGSMTGFYPYDFINVEINGLSSVLRFTLALLFPIYTLIAYGLIYLKNRVEKTAH